MSIVIEGLELPEDKTVQIIIENKRFGGVYCNTLGEKGLHRLGRVEETVFKLPTTHGDLVDVGELLYSLDASDFDDSDPIENLDNAVRIIGSARVIIPGEGR